MCYQPTRYNVARNKGLSAGLLPVSRYLPVPVCLFLTWAHLPVPVYLFLTWARLPACFCLSVQSTRLHTLHARADPAKRPVAFIRQDMSVYSFACELIREGWQGSLSDLGLVTHKLTEAGVTSVAQLKSADAQACEAALAGTAPGIGAFITALHTVRQLAPICRSVSRFFGRPTKRKREARPRKGCADLSSRHSVM